MYIDVILIKIKFIKDVYDVRSSQSSSVIWVFAAQMILSSLFGWVFGILLTTVLGIPFDRCDAALPTSFKTTKSISKNINGATVRVTSKSCTCLVLHRNEYVRLLKSGILDQSARKHAEKLARQYTERDTTSNVTSIILFAAFLLTTCSII